MAQPKLHELLAVESDLKNEFDKITEEAKTTFSKKNDHFQGHIKTLKMFDESRTKEEVGAEQHKEIVTTVADKLDYAAKTVIRYFDALLQKETTNQTACSDLILDGVTIAEKVPATFLLGMEDRLKKLRAVYEEIPTLPPGIAWDVDPAQRPGVFRTVHAETAMKTEQTIQHKVLYPHTENHPAQIEKWTEHIPVGMFSLQRWCSMISPARKSELLGRIDSLIKAVKQARQRANSAEVVSAHIAKKFFDYING